MATMFNKDVDVVSKAAAPTHIGE